MTPMLLSSNSSVSVCSSIDLLSMTAIPVLTKEAQRSRGNPENECDLISSRWMSDTVRLDMSTKLKKKNKVTTFFCGTGVGKGAGLLSNFKTL